MTKLYLIRHGETEWNASSKMQGTIDTTLNDKGLMQAELVANRLSEENIDVLYSSSLQRAMTTAQKISAAINKPVQELHNFKEINLGPWQGLTLDEIKNSYGEHYKLYVEKPSDFNMPGAETFIQVAERFCGAIQDIIVENRDKNIAVVSHGAAIKAAIISILGMDINYYSKFRIDNASISTLLFHDRYHGGVVVQGLNDICHLQRRTEHGL